MMERLTFPTFLSVRSRSPFWPMKQRGHLPKASGERLYPLVREELPLAVLDGLCSLSLDAVWYEDVMQCFRQPFCDNEEKPQHWKFVIPEMLTWPQHHSSPDFMLSTSEYSYALNQCWLSILFLVSVLPRPVSSPYLKAVSLHPRYHGWGKFSPKVNVLTQSFSLDSSSIKGMWAIHSLQHI